MCGVHVRRSSGLQRAKDLARVQADLATDAILKLAPSPARDALAHLAYKVKAPYAPPVAASPPCTAVPVFCADVGAFR